MKTEQIIEEREDSVKMKMRFKRFLSGFMAVATLASVIIQPVAVSASELEPEEIPFEQQYPELTEVQDSLDPDTAVQTVFLLVLTPMQKQLSAERLQMPMWQLP